MQEKCTEGKSKCPNIFNFIESLPHSVKKKMQAFLYSFVEIWHFARLVVPLIHASHSFKLGCDSENHK